MFLFGDGCDSYSVTADILKRWASNDDATKITFSAAGGKNSGGALSFAASTSILTSPVFMAGVGSAGKVLACGFWWKCASVPGGTVIIQSYNQLSSAEFARLSLVASGALRMGGTGGATIGTGTKNVCDGQYHWVELRWDMTTTTIAVKSYVDGIADLNITGSGNTIPTNLASFSCRTGSTLGATYFMDDPIWYDEVAGMTGDLNASTSFPLGAQQITTVRPQADGVVGFATATGGSTHYNQINETTSDSDTTYVEDSISNAQDLYDFAALGITPATIKTIIANAHLKNPNAGTINFKQIAKSSATQTDGTSTVAPTAYSTQQQSFPQDPNTSAAWASATPIDAATFGIKVV